MSCRSGTSHTSQRYKDKLVLGNKILAALYRAGALDLSTLPPVVGHMIRYLTEERPRGRRPRHHGVLLENEAVFLRTLPDTTVIPGPMDEVALCALNAYRHLIDFGYVEVLPSGEGWSCRRTLYGDRLVAALERPR